VAASIILMEDFCDDIENYLIVCLAGMILVVFMLHGFGNIEK